MAAPKEVDSAACPQAVLQLVERFEQHQASYKRQTYIEAQVRREFIDPFFAALGWDVDNKAGHAGAYKDLIHEDTVKVDGVTQRLADKTAIQRQIEATDRQIDRLVYELYGLTDEEIAIVEEATG